MKAIAFPQKRSRLVIVNGTIKTGGYYDSNEEDIILDAGSPETGMKVTKGGEDFNIIAVREIGPAFIVTLRSVDNE